MQTATIFNKESLNQYHLIALDMDGTLLNKSKEISAGNQEAIRAARALGKKVIIATGRPLVGIRKYLDQLDMIHADDYVVAFNGALVQSAKTGEILSQTTVTLDDYKRLYALSQDLGVHIHALTQDSVLTPQYNPYSEVECVINDIPYIEGPVADVPAETTIVKIMFIDEPSKLDAAVTALPEAVKEDYTIVRSADIFLEFLHKSVNKGTGVKAVADAFGINASEVICVGDAGNDMDMIHYAGLGVAMANAFDEVKAIADHITLSNEDDGVAAVIQTFML